MVTIDGKVDDREIVESEEIAVKLFGDSTAKVSAKPAPGRKTCRSWIA